MGEDITLITHLTKLKRWRLGVFKMFYHT